jgi:integrase
LPAKEIARDRVLSDDELARVILAARQIDEHYGGIVELLALTGQRREEVARLAWDELDLTQRVWTIPKSRTKNAKPHIVQLSDQSVAVLKRMKTQGPHVFAFHGATPFQDFARAKRKVDELSKVTGWRLHDLRRTCVSGMARLGIAPRCRQDSQPPVGHNHRGRSSLSTPRISPRAQRCARTVGRSYGQDCNGSERSSGS